MVERGLVSETAALYEHLRAEEAAGRPVDRSHGIWQSIGFKELELFLEAAAGQVAAGQEDGGGDGTSTATVERLRLQGIEKMQIATRHYARRQERWIARKTLPIVEEAGGTDHVFVLDSTDVSKWRDTVCVPARAITKAFLSGRCPLSQSVTSGTARAGAMPAAATFAGRSRRTLDTFTRRECDVCPGGKIFVLDDVWEKHLASRAHRRNAKRLASRNQPGGRGGDPQVPATEEVEGGEDDARSNDSDHDGMMLHHLLEGDDEWKGQEATHHATPSAVEAGR
jgi:tRNA dimethylallyltransferase